MHVRRVVLLLIKMLTYVKRVNAQFSPKETEFHGSVGHRLEADILAQYSPSSLLICATECRTDARNNRDCLSFSYNKARGLCSISGSTERLNPSVYVEDIEYVYFTRLWVESTTTISIPVSNIPGYQDCLELLTAGGVANGEYLIQAEGFGNNGLWVLCDMNKGGWLIIQNRKDGSVSFNRTWEEYEQGFGDFESEFWFGNENLRTLTSYGQWELQIEIDEYGRGGKGKAFYESFAVTGDDYRVQLGPFSDGNAGDSLFSHTGEDFSTMDHGTNSACVMTNSLYPGGGWWFGPQSNGCLESNLNGYYSRDVPTGEGGIIWNTHSSETLEKTSMKIRRKY